MANKKFVVKLSREERERLDKLIRKGKASAKIILKARILLKADQGEGGEGWSDEEICEALDTNITMVARVREKVLKELSDVQFAHAEKIVLVQDNLNTHSAASLYEAFTASQARRLVERFEWNYTPKHSSWLNMAESELATLSSQCLDRRIADRPTLEREVEAWVVRRNTDNAKAD
jgi:hypothetical protein